MFKSVQRCAKVVDRFSKGVSKTGAPSQGAGKDLTITLIIFVVLARIQVQGLMVGNMIIQRSTKIHRVFR